MNQSKLFTCRRSKSARRWAITVMIAMMMPGVGGQFFVPTVSAQTAPTGQGFVLDAGDLRFIYEQILVAQDHAAGGTLLGPGPNQVHDPQLPRGLRTVDGSFNNLVPFQVDNRFTPPVPAQFFGASDQLFPRRLTPVFRTAEQGTSYLSFTDVIDSQPRRRFIAPMVIASRVRTRSESWLGRFRYRGDWT